MAVPVKSLPTPATLPSHETGTIYPHTGHDGGANKHEVNPKALYFTLVLRL